MYIVLYRVAVGLRTEPRHLHVPAGRAARGGRDAVGRAGALHQPLVPAQLRRRDRRGRPTSAHHHLCQATHRKGRRGMELNDTNVSKVPEVLIKVKLISRVYI